MSGLIDLHCHVLPGIDDGPPSIEESLALARAAVAAGTATIVATPHVNHTYPENDATRIADATQELRAELAANDIPLALESGAELALTRGGELDAEQLAALRLGDGPYLLVECPSVPAATGFEASLHAIAAHGNRILLAHAERIPAFRDDPSLVERLVGRGMLVQITAASLSGRFGADAQRYAETLLRGGLVHDIASDAHSADKRGPGIVPHLEHAGYAALAGHFARDVPAAILAGEEIPPAPALPAPPRRGVLRRLLGKG